MSKMDRSSMSSSTESDEESYQTAIQRRNSKKPKCSSKNAILARRNRIKKKKYLEDLENEVKSLRAENSVLRTNVDGYRKDMEVVRKENRYLRNILASRKEISRLLGVIQDKTGLLTSSSLCRTEVSNKRDMTPKTCAPIPSPVEPKQAPISATPLVDSDIFSDGGLIESPITHNDVSLSGPECDDEMPMPSNLFSSDDHDYLNFDTDFPEDWLAGDEEMPNIGVCLHVAKKKISLEFCQYCNENASQCWDGVAV